MMMNALSESDLLSLLKNGTKRTVELMVRITDYQGRPITTEYMLTSDIAREILETNHQAEVEYLNRKFANGLTKRKNANTNFGSKRTDIAILRDDIIPLAIIEIKIGVTTLRGIRTDLVKITSTIDALKPEYASSVWGAAVFQVHIAGSNDRSEIADFEIALDRMINNLKTELSEHANNFPNYSFSLHSLQTNNQGFYDASFQDDDAGGLIMSEHGHATRYYTVLIKSKIPEPKIPQTFEEMKARDQT